MRRSLVIVLGIAALTASIFFGLALRAMWFDAPSARVEPVNEGDCELAFIHTSTNLSNWERFVAGAFLTARRIPDMTIDDKNAFLDETTDVPELVIGMKGIARKVRVRWYKLAGGIKSSQWVDALAQRDPPPIAIIGGGSSDRAIELATSLAVDHSWKGPAPLLFIMQATANQDAPAGFQQGPPLIDIYPGRTFRFCFTNLQMAQAVMDFVASNPSLRPMRHSVTSISAVPFAGASLWSGLAALVVDGDQPPPRAHAILWQDDPYSVDLTEQFGNVIRDHNTTRGERGAICAPLSLQKIPFSIGGFYRANRWEAEAAAHLVRQLPTGPGQRSLLILPAVAAPARRVLRSLCSSAPLIGQNLVAVTGDSIGLNTLYRDAGFAWNIRSLPIPLVAFTHANPVAWDPPGSDYPYPLREPNATEDAYRNADLLTQVISALYASRTESMPDADELASQLWQADPPFFDEYGDRLPGSGEYLMWLQPIFKPSGPFGTPVFAEGELRIFRRKADGKWFPIRDVLKVGTNEVGWDDRHGVNREVSHVG